MMKKARNSDTDGDFAGKMREEMNQADGRKKRIGIYLERHPDSGGAYQYCLAMLKSLASFPKERFEIVAFIMYEEWRPITEGFGLRTIYAQKNILEKVIYHLAELALPVAACRKLCRFLHPFARALRREHIEACIYPCADKISFMMDTPAVVSVFDLMHRYLTEFPEISAPEIYKSRERSYTNIARYAQMIFVDSEGRHDKRPRVLIKRHHLLIRDIAEDFDLLLQMQFSYLPAHILVPVLSGSAAHQIDYIICSVFSFSPSFRI